MRNDTQESDTDRCDVCGEVVTFEERVRIEDTPDFGQELREEIPDIETQFWESMADILEQRDAVGNTTLANALRETHRLIAHKRCLRDDTSWLELESELNEVADRMLPEEPVGTGCDPDD